MSLVQRSLFCVLVPALLFMACGCDSKAPNSDPQRPETGDSESSKQNEGQLSASSASEEERRNGASANRKSPRLSFVDVTSSSGIGFQHFSGGTGKHFIVETVTAGVATLDYDMDGLLDIYFLNGAPLLDAKVDATPVNRLYRNRGGFRFEDVTEESGVGDPGFALGVAAADYDADGDEDLIVSNFGPNVLFENLGDGTFARRSFGPTKSAPRVGAGVSLFDADNDGLLDIYFANYIDFTFDKDVNREIFGVPAAPGPKDYEPDSDTLYRNLGDGSFEDVSEQSGIATVAGAGMGVVAFDYDNDADTDVFVCNDSAANFLFENDGSGNFEETAVFTSVAYGASGDQQASMGVDVADFNHDGNFDLVTTNFVDEVPTLYQNSGQGYFDDIGSAARLGIANRSVTWGVGFADFDHDSWDDLFIASGHLIEGTAAVNDTEQFESPNVCLLSKNGNLFEQVQEQEPFLLEQVSRGVALDDLDSDGAVDVVVLNLNDRPQIIQNASAAGSSLRISLVGTTANREGVGARVELQGNGLRIYKERVAGRGYQGHFGSLLQFGLDENTGPFSVKITWPGGKVEQHSGLRAIEGSQRYVIIEGHTDAVLVEPGR